MPLQQITETPQQLRAIAAAWENMAHSTHRTEFIEWLIRNASAYRALADSTEGKQCPVR